MKIHNPKKWSTMMMRIGSGELEALGQLTQLVENFLRKYQAYDVSEYWDDICQDVISSLWIQIAENKLREERAFVNYAGRMVQFKLSDIRSKERKRRLAIREAMQC